MPDPQKQEVKLKNKISHHGDTQCLMLLIADFRCICLHRNYQPCQWTTARFDEALDITSPRTSYLHALENVLFMCCNVSGHMKELMIQMRKRNPIFSFNQVESSEFAFTAPCMPLKLPSRNRVARAIQKFLLNPKSVWNTILPQKQVAHKNPCAKSGCKWGPNSEEEEWIGNIILSFDLFTFVMVREATVNSNIE